MNEQSAVEELSLKMNLARNKRAMETFGLIQVHEGDDSEDDKDIIPPTPEKELSLEAKRKMNLARNKRAMEAFGLTQVYWI